MSTTPSDLLRLLDSSVGAARAGQVGGHTQVTGPNGPHAVPFADLLSKAQRGEIGSGLPVSIDRKVDLKLDDGQLGRLAKAADAAEAAGLHTAAALIDGMSLVLDVHTRTITGQVDLTGGVVSGIDGVVSVPADGALGGGPSTGMVKLPAALPSNKSVTDLLAALQTQPSHS